MSDQLFVLAHCSSFFASFAFGVAFEWTVKTEFPTPGEGESMFKTFVIKETQRGILMKHGNFVRVLESGESRVFDPSRAFGALHFELERPAFTHDLKDFLIAKRPDVIERHFELVQTGDAEIAVVMRDGSILEIVGPQSRALFWRGFTALKIERLNVRDGLMLARGHALLDRKNAAWVKKHFTDVQALENAVVIVSRAGRVTDLVTPGERVLYWLDAEAISVVNQSVAASLPKHIQDAILAANVPWVDRFERIELNEFELGLVRRNKAITDLISPTASAMYFRDGVTRLETVDIQTDFRVRDDVAQAVQDTGISVFVQFVEIPEYHTGALFVNGKLTETLVVGTHAFWKVGRNLRVSVVDTRLQTLEVSGQEILSKDKVSLRLNLMAAYRVSDAQLAASKLSDIEGFLYKELQFGLRAAVGTRTLDELLEDKGVIDAVVGAYIREKTANLGLEVESVGVKDIILPGEMKLILSKVVEAEKLAQANVIRRREETAATRSLLNTAKVMEDNPVALRLKELETLEKLTEKIGSITVTNGLEGVLTDLVRIRK
jgi:regulator of protease activity HflC (stomatin/prohibitin superfamily)